jgi:Zn-dependent peptidase ImmA (M78 family)
LSNPDAFIEIKQKWQVSLQAIGIRAFKLNLIDYQKYRYFFISINKKGYKVIEPLDNDIPNRKTNEIKEYFTIVI